MILIVKNLVYFTAVYSLLSYSSVQILCNFFKAVIAGKSLISAALDIDRILHFANLPTTLGQEILPTHFTKIPRNSKNVGGGGVTPLQPPPRPGLWGGAWLIEYVRKDLI